MIIIVMGVTGAGKSTVGAALARRLGWRFADADDFHSEANWKKLAAGSALTDIDRAPWLAELRKTVTAAIARAESLVLACSALKQAYRDALVPPGANHAAVRFVYLDADPGVTAQRLEKREAHRASPLLLPSQLAELEVPADSLRLPNTLPVDEIVARIVAAFAIE